jgi:CheY-like chemotaxis protein
MSATGLVLCDDLIFFSRIAGAARAAGLTARMVRSPDELLTAARAAPPGGVVLDVHFPALDLPALLGALAALPAPPPVTAYGSHVEAEVLRAARAAGCARVLPRSRFVELLETDVRAWFGAA